MTILVLHDSLEIKAWLVNEPLESAAEHIANGYPELQPEWQAETLTATLLEVTTENEYRADLYQVIDGQLTTI